MAGGLTESAIQDLLWRERQDNIRMCVPNLMFGFGECDFLALSKSGWLWEYEIKCSRSDWITELKNANGEVVSWQWGKKSNETSKFKKHQHMQLRQPYIGSAERRRLVIPNHYVIVAPKGVAFASELPEYAGLLEIAGSADGGRFMVMTKPAPRIHTERTPNEVVLDMGRAMMWRYFRLRTATLTSTRDNERPDQDSERTNPLPD